MSNTHKILALGLLATLVVAAIPAVALAQGPGSGPPRGMGQDRRPGPGAAPGARMGMGGPGDDAMGRYFFPPHLVLERAEEIGLQPEQRQVIEQLLADAESRFRANRYALGNEMTRIAAMAVDQPIDEAAITEQLDRVLDLERQIKREQLLMLVRVKNLLTAEQQAAMAELRREPGPPMRRQER